MNAIAKVPAEARLVHYDNMCRAIDAAYEVDTVKGIRDEAQRAELYYKQAQNVEAERRVCEIRLRAERKAGELLAKRAKTAGGRGTPSNQYQRVVGSDDPSPPKLLDIGVSKQQSKDWQKLAAVPEALFEEALSRPDVKPTTSSIISANQPPKKNAINDNALWLWGRLQDFEREGVLASDPHALFENMLPHMQATTQRLAPLVINWLGRLPQ